MEYFFPLELASLEGGKYWRRGDAAEKRWRRAILDQDDLKHKEQSTLPSPVTEGRPL